MHELSLFGQVAASRYDQVLHILAGITVMQPQQILERHIVLQPRNAGGSSDQKPKNPAKPVSASSTSFMVHLIQSIPASATGSERSFANDVHALSWSMRMMETPEPETKSIALRRMEESALSEPQLQQYFDVEKYRQTSEYYIEGHRLVSKNVIINLFRVMLPGTGDQQPVEITTSMPPSGELKLLDKSGAFVLEASVRIEDRTKPALLQAATEELNAFRNEMRGSVDLRMPERLSLDTRVRANG